MPRNRSRQDDVEDEFEDEDAAPARPGNERVKRLLLDFVGRWYWIAFGLVLGLLGAGYYLSKAPEVYSASASLLIKTQTSSVMSRDQVEDVALGSTEAMNTAVARIKRFELLERVASREDVRRLSGIAPPEVDWRPQWLIGFLGEDAAEPASEAAPPTPDVLAARLRGWLSVSVDRGTRLINVTITHPVPDVAKALANAVAREYIAQIQSETSSGRTSTIEILRTESKEAREKLQAANSALSVYARAVEAHESLDAQEVEVARLSQRYLPAHPKMESASAEYERLKRRFIAEFEVARRSPNDKAYWENIDSELPDPEADREEFLRVARQQLLARIGVLNSEIDSQTSVFNSMLTRIEESTVNQEGGESSAQINSLARTPGRPSAPDSNKIYGAGAFGGLALGFGLAFLVIRSDNKFHTVAQIEDDCATTVLAAVSQINPDHLDQATKLHLEKHPEDASDRYDDWDTHLVFRPGTLHTNYAEMYRILRASISLLGDEKKRRVTMFTSALLGEGKTMTSINFALAAAGQKRRTLLIDLDLRKPAVHKAFGIARETVSGGITEALAGQVEIQDTVVTGCPEENLHIIFSGKRAPNPGELLDTARLRTILAWAADAYDVVVLDTAPLLAVPDTRIIAPLVDNFCLVVRGQYVPKGAVRRTLEVIEEDGSKLDGIVFNGFVEKKRFIGQNYSYGQYRTSRYGRAYRYGYGKYGSYGSYGSEEEDDPPKRKNRKRRRSKA
jgi:capsular exopolysaccharide synthesis family protein